MTEPATSLAERRARRRRRRPEPPPSVPAPRGGGRMWINGRELGGGSRFEHLAVLGG